MTDWFELQEQATERAVRLSPEQLREIRAALPHLTVEPGNGSDCYDLNPESYVGVVQLPNIGVSIRPKLDMERVLFLWSYAFDPKHWRDREVALPQATDLISALAHVFASELERQIRSGLLEGYRRRTENAPTVRGRILLAEQWQNTMRRIPVAACEYDEFTSDISENQLLKAAIHVLRCLPLLDQGTERALARCEQELATVASTRFTRGRVPEIHYHRGNLRYLRALELARLILSRVSFDIEAGRVPLISIRGFLFDMNRVFESFVRTALREALGLPPWLFGSADEVGMESNLYLDEGRTVLLRPDLLWAQEKFAVFVGDVKYKRVTLPSMPNPDIYQMLAYLIGSGLRTGLLIYPRGEDETGDRTIKLFIEGQASRILVRSIDISGPAESILAQVKDLARAIASIASDRSGYFGSHRSDALPGLRVRER